MQKKKKDAEVSFLGSLMIFFKPKIKWIKDKRIIRSSIERQMALSSYDGPDSSEESKLSFGFGIAKTVSVILLVLLLLTTVLFGSGAISYEKVYYMFKDIGYIKSFGESTPSSLTYSRPVQNQVFGHFKGGLAVASDSEIKTFTSTGRLTMSIGSEFTNPRMSASDSYLLVYDQGSYSYTIYNSFIAVHRDKLDSPISFATMADNGSFLIVTRSARYESAVKVYDSNFKLISEYSKNDRVIYASLSSSGRYAAILSLSAEQGESRVALNVIDCKKSSIVSSTSFDGSMPYRCDFLTDDRVAVTLDDRLCVIDRSGRIKGEYYFSSSLERIDVSGGKVALLFSENGALREKTLTVISSDGSLIYADTIKGNVRDMKLGQGVVYILQSSKVQRINTTLGTKSEYLADDTGDAIVVFPDGSVALCTQTAAVYISFD